MPLARLRAALPAAALSLLLLTGCTATDDGVTPESAADTHPVRRRGRDESRRCVVAGRLILRRAELARRSVVLERGRRVACRTCRGGVAYC